VPPALTPTRSPPYRWLGWVAGVAVLVCLASIVGLTLLVPGTGSYPPNGGFLPLSARGAR
jgi:hypothetical protein